MSENLKIGALSFFKDGFKSMPSWAKVFIMLLFTLLISLVVVVKFTLKPMTDSYIQWHEVTLEKEELKKSKKGREQAARELIKQKRTTDSLMEIEDALKSTIALRNIEDIEEYIQRLSRKYENLANVSFWSMHNGGKVMDVNSPLYLEVHRSSDTSVEENWSEPEKIPAGYLWYALELEKKRLVYIEDVTQVPEMWVGRAKENMKANNTKSVIAAIVKNVGSDWYFVSIAFTVPNAYDQNFTLYRDINSFKNYVKKRI